MQTPESCLPEFVQNTGQYKYQKAVILIKLANLRNWSVFGIGRAVYDPRFGLQVKVEM